MYSYVACELTEDKTSMGQDIKTVSDSNFEAEVLKASQPTLVDFWAEWCAPCRALTPIIDEMATKYKGKLQVAKMNIDEHPNTPGRYSVRAIPTLLIFKGGEVVDQVVGLVSRAKLDDLIAKHL
jgi:thioredoxin 1